MHKEAWQRVYVGIWQMHREHACISVYVLISASKRVVVL